MPLFIAIFTKIHMNSLKNLILKGKILHSISYKSVVNPDKLEVYRNPAFPIIKQIFICRGHNVNGGTQCKYLGKDRGAMLRNYRHRAARHCSPKRVKP